ncbi:MAG: helix-turn-helix domain-containing protein [Acidocella sp.]|nr:helix-turn-helix domain-containing protein [Acidocella sp.]
MRPNRAGAGRLGSASFGSAYEGSGLLDKGMSYAAVAKVLLLDDDTIRIWRLLYEQDGIEGLTNLGYEGRACRLSNEQQAKLVTWIVAEFGIEYQPDRAVAPAGQAA